MICAISSRIARARALSVSLASTVAISVGAYLYDYSDEFVGIVEYASGFEVQLEEGARLAIVKGDRVTFVGPEEV